MNIPRLSKKESIILGLLINHGEMYGLEMVKSEPAALKRGTVYVTLDRMAEKGYVTSRQLKDPAASGLPRRLFRATGLGEQTYQAWELASSAFAVAGRRP